MIIGLSNNCTGSLRSLLIHALVVCSIKKQYTAGMRIQEAYIKDLMYLKRNTMFLPDRWGLKTPQASQSSLNEIVFRSHANVRSNHFAKWIFQKMVKVGYAFFPQKRTN
jgi:hypothetical protein